MNIHSFLTHAHHRQPPFLAQSCRRPDRQARRHPSCRHRSLRAPRLLPVAGRRRRARGGRRGRHRVPLLPQQGRPPRLDLRADDARGDCRGPGRARGRRRSARAPARVARLHLERLGRDRDLAVVFQVELRQSTKFMERFSSTYLRDYLGMIRETIADGQAPALFRRDINPRPPPRCSSARSTKWRPTGS